MTAAPIVPGPHDAVAATAAQALAAVLPSSEQLEPGAPQPGTEQVTSLFSAAVIADLGGAVSGRVGVLVAEELTSALATSPLGELDLAAAVQPALDAAVERRLQRFVAAVALIEGQIVRIDNEAAIDAGQIGHQEGQVVDILAVDFDKRAIHAAFRDRAVNCLDQR